MINLGKAIYKGVENKNKNSMMKAAYDKKIEGKFIKIALPNNGNMVN